MSTLLAATRQSLGPAPRTIKQWDNVEPPSWMKPNDPLRAAYQTNLDLLRNGDVVWGHLVQANSLLFRPGHEDSPAQVVFATRADDDLEPDRLERIANAAYALKGREPADPAVAAVAQALTREQERHPTIDLPNAVTYGVPMRMAIVMVHRVHLPGRVLHSFALPLVANRARDAVTLLPARYWAKDLTRAWLALGAGPR